MPGIFHQAGCCCAKNPCAICGGAQPDAVGSGVVGVCAGANGVYPFDHLTLPWPGAETCRWYFQWGVDEGPYRELVLDFGAGQMLAWVVGYASWDLGVVFEGYFGFGDPGGLDCTGGTLHVALGG